MADALKYLLKQEWSVGNGQCPDCLGVNEIFLSQYAPAKIGHKQDCGHAAAIIALGGKPMMLGDCPPPAADSWAAFSKRRWDGMCADFQADFERSLVESLLAAGSKK